VIVISPDRFREMPWKNGLGSTIEIHRADGPGGEMQWRVSIATIANDGPFSPFPDCDRHIMTIVGSGIVLCGGPLGPLYAAPAFEPVRFSGDWTITASLIAGPVRDFNLIVNRSFGRGELSHALLTKPQLIDQGQDWYLVYVLSGQVLCAGEEVLVGHALLGQNPKDATLEPIGGPARIATCGIWVGPAQ
jgi:hypothetical protein